MMTAKPEDDYTPPPAQNAAENVAYRLYVLHRQLIDLNECTVLTGDPALLEQLAAAQEAVRVAHERARWLAAKLESANVANSLASRSATPQAFTARLERARLEHHRPARNKEEAR